MVVATEHTSYVPEVLITEKQSLMLVANKGNSTWDRNNKPHKIMKV